MDKQAFIDRAVEASRPLGARARSSYNAAAVAEKAAARWDAEHTPEALEKAAFIAMLEAKGGKNWEFKRVYFNEVAVGDAGRTFDFYVDLETREICGARLDEEKAAASLKTGL